MTWADNIGGRVFLEGSPEPDEYTFAYIEGGAAWIFEDNECPYRENSEEWRLWQKGYNNTLTLAKIAK
jgi:hypothetical protein